MNPAEAFLDVLIASMKDAICENKLTQLKTQMENPETGKLELVRLVIMPEKMDHEWPSDAPLGTPSITCPRCGRTSYHPKDIEELYCGHCHMWHEDMKGQQ